MIVTELPQQRISTSCMQIVQHQSGHCGGSLVSKEARLLHGLGDDVFVREKVRGCAVLPHRLWQAFECG